eukprot:2618363-Prymnesium_polylepis.1
MVCFSGWCASADVEAADTCTYRLQSHQVSLASRPLDHTGSILAVGSLKTGLRRRIRLIASNLGRPLNKLEGT